MSLRGKFCVRHFTVIQSLGSQPGLMCMFRRAPCDSHIIGRKVPNSHDFTAQISCTAKNQGRKVEKDPRMIAGEGKELEVFEIPKNCQVSNHILGWELYTNSNKLNNEVTILQHTNLRRLDCHKGEMASMNPVEFSNAACFSWQNVDSQNHHPTIFCPTAPLSHSR